MRYPDFKSVGLLAVALCLLCLGKPVLAEVALDGSFVAGQNCSAVQSIKKQSNPVPLEVGHSYQIVAANK